MSHNPPPPLRPTALEKARRARLPVIAAGSTQAELRRLTHNFYHKYQHVFFTSHPQELTLSEEPSQSILRTILPREVPLDKSEKGSVKK
ncbi:hypothetical protein R1flu_027810 [Riccia fluitans]|uniref:Uncharacterized protein n=1 Tax=Riccia fluitans TaxID=41844 RepID=A0ABD1XJX2_9MARC